MSQSVLFFIIVLVIVFAIMVSSYIHKRHHEFNMDDIERAVRGAYPKGVRSIGKSELVDAVKKHFHCSSTGDRRCHPPFATGFHRCHAQSHRRDGMH